MPETWTVDELMCAVIARAVSNDDVLLEGIGTFLPTVGYELARCTHAPEAWIFTPCGTVFRNKTIPLSLDRYEAAAMAAAVRCTDYAEMALRYLPAYLKRARATWKEFARPAQVDGWGNTNNVVIGEYGRPVVRLPGAVGIPDGTTTLREINLYAPRHSRQTLVAECDFISGLGLRGRGGRSAEQAGRPRRLVTNLAVIGFSEEGAFISSAHPGIDVAEIRRSTGFPLIDRKPLVTEPPSAEELRLIREVIDPEGLRKLEMLDARRRRAVLRERFSATFALQGSAAGARHDD